MARHNPNDLPLPEQVKYWQSYAESAQETAKEACLALATARRLLRTALNVDLRLSNQLDKLRAEARAAGLLENE